MLLDDIDRRLIDGWQRDFPIVSAPYAAIASALGTDEANVISRLARLQECGALSRVGAVVRPNTAGASSLVAISVPERDIESAAEALVIESGVNHAYEREHAYNLWFVVTAQDREGVAAAIARVEGRTGARALTLPMLRAFHIDLGFALFDSAPPASKPNHKTSGAVDADDRRLLACIEDGIGLTPRPFLPVALRVGWTEARVLERLADLVSGGVVARFGLVLRHRSFGYAANAMVVWDLPDNQLERIAASFAEQEFVTLCYERPRRPGWRYNLFTMIHGRERAAVLERVAELSAMAPQARDHAVLFSRRCFRQRGARLSAA